MDARCHSCGKSMLSYQTGKVCHKCAKPHCLQCTETYFSRCCVGCMGHGDTPNFKGGEDIDTGQGGSQGDPSAGQGTGQGGEENSEGQSEGQGQAEELGMSTNGGEGQESEESLRRRIRHSMHKQSGKNIDQDKLWSVQLTDVGQKKIMVIRAVRDLLKLGLREAKDLVDSLEATGRKPFVSVGLPTEPTIVNAITLLRAGAKVKVIPYGDHSDKPKPDKDEDEGQAPKMFKVYAYFTADDGDLLGYMLNQGLSQSEADSVVSDGRFGRHGEVMLTCLWTPMGIQVIDCDYLD